jgi:hypothetical protein
MQLRSRVKTKFGNEKIKIRIIKLGTNKYNRGIL